MDDVNKEIEDLFQLIKSYGTEYKTASTERRRVLGQAVFSSTEALNQLWDKKKAQSEDTDNPVGGEAEEPRLQEFTFKVNPKAEFPPRGGGTSLFCRPHHVERMVDMFVSRNESDSYGSYCFHGPQGSGKTVLLKLFGRELQQRGFVVYMLNASALDRFPTSYFKRLAKRWAASQRQVALLVDEIHGNVRSEHWTDLLEEAPSNLLVVGTGSPDLQVTAPPFQKLYPDASMPAFTQLTYEDMPQVLAHFVPLGEADGLWEAKRKALDELRLATGGHLFPFVTFAKHLMDPENAPHLSNLSEYLFSKEFHCHEDFVTVRDRCYRLSPPSLKVLEQYFMDHMGDPRGIDRAIEAGMWVGNEFTPPLVVFEGFRRLVTMPSRAHTELKQAVTGERVPMAVPGAALDSDTLRKERNGAVRSPRFPPRVRPLGTRRTFSTVAVSAIRRIGRLL